MGERGRSPADAGQAVPLVLALVVLALVLVLALVPLGRSAIDAARARTAADAAALAGAAAGKDAAQDAAAANAARLVDYVAQGDAVWVEVTVGDAHARAKARREEQPGR